MRNGSEHPLPRGTMGQKLYIQPGDKYDWQARGETTIFAFFDTKEEAQIYLNRIEWSRASGL